MRWILRLLLGNMAKRLGGEFLGGPRCDPAAVKAAVEAVPGARLLRGLLPAARVSGRQVEFDLVARLDE